MDASECSVLSEAFDVLSSHAKDLYLDKIICQLFSLPSTIEFTRDYVAKNRPVVIRGACSKWEACNKWNSDYLRNISGNKFVSVAATPNGLADGIATKMPENKEYFVLPEERRMKMSEFLDKLSVSDDDQILYIQKQNSNLSEDFPELMSDIDVNTLKFAYEAFNKNPDAINFWMGDSRSITSLHKDPYENIYCVISGYKDFILISPTDYPFIKRSKYPLGIYKTENGKIQIDPVTTGEKIEWCSIDPLNPNLEKFPEFKKASPITVRVNEGDILYLPSLWYHHVQQSHKCIAINFWFDMDYDSRYCYYKFIEKLCGNGE
ncbi:bifunctional peptidase and (3S)-lysyl hydroxylase Jmjd7 [Contarinia nasturtii]|uniref:bifunctional peptidase and (3S)-lysyl hydroxylase Jmjd7 n=1 Tax=Contarinia nasturtii TaxID=265458 RepID=UPI0012D425AD|nr:bifunctional peptidase and (3S)-lysyl hydroxylase Jmjd7 [Contarinia nasturtii]